MARPRSPNRDKAKLLWLESGKKRLLKDIAEELQVSEEQIRKWKNQDKWDKVTLPNSNSNVTNHKGAQPDNKNAVGHGAPKQNSNAVKHGLFRKWLPEEAFSIIQEMPKAPLDVLWDQIQIAYAAIIRAQKIMYVTDKEDCTTTKIGEKTGDTVSEERWEVQQAWDKQGNFLKAQARAQGELRSLIRQYDELVHKDWELATEEQKARIGYIKAQAEALVNNSDSEKEQVQDWKAAIMEIARRRKEKEAGG